MNRAYTFFEVKDFVERETDYLIKGVATTPSTDRMEDVVESDGAEYTLPVPVLWQHRSGEPIGNVVAAKVSKKGIAVDISIPKVTELGRLRDRIEEAVQSIKYKLVKGLSIGFRALKDGVETIEGSFGLRFIKWEWLELSLVTIPANADATIQSIKSFDAEQRAASGRKLSDDDRPTPPAPGKYLTKTVKAQEAKHQMKKTIAEQISDFSATRQTKAARMIEIMEKAGDTGETLDTEAQTEYDDLKGEVESIDKHLVRLNDMEKLNLSKSVVVEPQAGSDPAVAAQTRTSVVQVKRNVEKGIILVRTIGAKHLGFKHGMSPIEIAKSKFADTPEVEMILRAAVEAGTTTGTTFAAPLVVLDNAVGEFIDLLRPATIIGRIPGLRRVPFNIQVPRATGDPTVSWVGEASVKPVSAMAFDSITMRFAKVAGIVPVTEELLRFSNPAAEGLIRDSLVSAVAYLTDRDFLDPTKAEVTNVSPASVTNGVTPVVATGTTADALRDDLATLLATYAAANMSFSGLVLVMTSQQAVRISMMRNALGQREFDGIGVNGGTLEGIPVITSENMVATGGSPVDGGLIVAMNAPEIMLADEGGVDIDISREASLQMDTAPDSPNTASTVLVSLWQRNMVAIRAERFINWKKRRDGAVQYITSAKYA